jgi:BolA protein
MLSRRDRIEALLRQEFAPEALIVADESARHAGGPTAESHYNLTLVSSALRGLRSVQRHRLVYAALRSELDTGLHALTMQLWTPEEQPSATAALGQSPACRGG